MQIFVKVKTNAGEEKIEQISGEEYKISVKEQPEKGKANTAVIKLVSEYFDVPQNSIRIARGATNKNKVIVIKN